MTPQVALLLAALLAGLPAGGARGGKAAKGAGGGYGGSHGLTNFSAREMTWEDIVLAMQLSAMCFGALLALCIVACCAYKICGPAEEIEYSPRYSAFKTEHPRFPPELLREIYTLSLSASAHHQTPGEMANKAAAPTGPTGASEPASRRPADAVTSGPVGRLVEAGPRVTSVSRESLGGDRGSKLAHLPNGRPRGPPGPGDLTPSVTPGPPRRPLTLQNTRADVYKPPRLLNLNCMLDGRPRLLTLSAMSSSRAAKEVAGRGAANRLAAYNQHSSTLDLARAAAASIPSLSQTHRSLSEPYTSLV